MAVSVKDVMTCVNSPLVLPGGSSPDLDAANVDTIGPSDERKKGEIRLPELDTAVATPVQPQNIKTPLELAQKPGPPPPKPKTKAQPKPIMMKRVGGGFKQIFNSNKQQPQAPEKARSSSVSQEKPVSRPAPRRQRWLKPPSYADK
jgi:hypothetical protein